MTSIKTRLAASVMATMAVAGIATAPAANAQPGAISQGETIVTEIGPGNLGLCTAGYIDKARRTMTITGHCSHGKVGSRVMDKDQRPIGHVVKNWHKEGDQASDISIITIYPDVKLGGNTYSGDAWVHPRTIRRGETMCSRGAKSNAVHCGKITDIDRNLIIGTRNAGGTFGDSGGPAWIPGRGFIGVFSGLGEDHVVFTYPDPEYKTVTQQWIDDRRKDIENIQRTVQTNTRNAIIAFLNDLEFKFPQFKPQIQQLRKEYGLL